MNASPAATEMPINAAAKRMGWCMMIWSANANIETSKNHSGKRASYPVQTRATLKFPGNPYRHYRARQGEVFGSGVPPLLPLDRHHRMQSIFQKQQLRRNAREIAH